MGVGGPASDPCRGALYHECPPRPRRRPPPSPRSGAAAARYAPVQRCLIVDDRLAGADATDVVDGTDAGGRGRGRGVYHRPSGITNRSTAGPGWSRDSYRPEQRLSRLTRSATGDSVGRTVAA